MDKRWYIIACILLILSVIGAGYSQRHTIIVTPRETENSTASDTVTAVSETTASPETTAAVTVEEPDTFIRYILNTNTMKFHYPTCASVKKIKDKNLAKTSAAREQLLDEGYSPCGNCKP